MSVADAEFERALGELSPEIHVHCYRMLGSVFDADDALQETVLRAWRARADVDRVSGIRPWLYRIATNRCLTMLERRGRRELPMDLSDDAPAGERHWLEPYPLDADPQAAAVSGEAVRLAFIAAVQWLPGVQRASLLLRDVLGFTAKETAEVLGITVAAGNSALQRARASLRDRGTALDRPADAASAELARRYAEAWEADDMEAILALLADDAEYAMPPLPQWYRGRDAIGDFLVAGPLNDRWRFLPTVANGQPAFATYMWDPTAGVFVAVSVDVLGIRDGAIASVLSFLDGDLVERFGLPRTVPG